MGFMEKLGDMWWQVTPIQKTVFVTSAVYIICLAIASIAQAFKATALVDDFDTDDCLFCLDIASDVGDPIYLAPCESFRSNQTRFDAIDDEAFTDGFVGVHGRISYNIVSIIFALAIPPFIIYVTFFTANSADGQARLALYHGTSIVASTALIFLHLEFLLIQTEAYSGVECLVYGISYSQKKFNSIVLWVLMLYPCWIMPLGCGLLMCLGENAGTIACLLLLLITSILVLVAFFISAISIGNGAIVFPVLFLIHIFGAAPSMIHLDKKSGASTPPWMNY